MRQKEKFKMRKTPSGATKIKKFPKTEIQKSEMKNGIHQKSTKKSKNAKDIDILKLGS